MMVYMATNKYSEEIHRVDEFLLPKSEAVADAPLLWLGLFPQTRTMNDLSAPQQLHDEIDKLRRVLEEPCLSR